MKPTISSPGTGVQHFASLTQISFGLRPATVMAASPDTSERGFAYPGVTPSERFVDVSWNSEGMTAPFRVQIEVRALDRGGLLSDLTRVLSDYRVNILAAALKTDGDQVASGNFSFELADLGHLNAVLSALRRVDGVFEAVRIGSDS